MRETHLIRAPKVTAVKRTVYVIDWRYHGLRTYTDYNTGHEDTDLVECEFRKTMFSKAAAYRRAAWGFVINAKAAQGCTRHKCALGDHYYDADCAPGGGEKDTRCKYCNEELAAPIVDRLARWLKWRDSKPLPQPAPEVKT